MLPTPPAYVIFHDHTLAAVAALRPRDLEALAAVDGIGARKLERHGPALLRLVAEANRDLGSRAPATEG